MATDKSEPRIGLIVGIGLLSIVTALALRALLQSYFIAVTEDELRAKVLAQPPVQLQRLHEDEQQHLTAGPLPIDRAVQALSTGQRPAGISPLPSTDWAALTGWVQCPVTPTPGGRLPAQQQPASTPTPTQTQHTPGQNPGSSQGPTGSPAPSHP